MYVVCVRVCVYNVHVCECKPFLYIVHYHLPPPSSVSLGHLLSMETSGPHGGTAEPAEGEGAAVGQVPG